MKPKPILAVYAAILCTSTSQAFAQAAAPPPAVIQAFKAAYPTVSRVEWEAEDGGWEAEFKHNRQEVEVLYNAQGQLQETELDIRPAELPAAVREKIAQDYPGYKIREAEVVELPGGIRKYEVEVRKGGSEVEALYSSEGIRIEEGEDD